MVDINSHRFLTSKTICFHTLRLIAFTCSTNLVYLLPFLLLKHHPSMAEVPPKEFQIRVNSRRGSNVVHPVEAEAPPVSSSLGPILYREVKHIKKWFPWLIPLFVIANVVMFIITMYVNDCPKNSDSCIADFLGRFSFQPMKENPLLGPSSHT